jgi:hypothetical protein
MLERDRQETALCVHSIHCECARNYIGKTGRPLAIWLHEYRHNIKDDLLEKSKLAQPVYKLELYKLMIRAGIENARNRPISCLTNLISPPIVEISPS